MLRFKFFTIAAPKNETNLDKSITCYEINNFLNAAVNLLVSFYEAGSLNSFLDKLKLFNNMVGCNIPAPTDRDEMLKLLALFEEDDDLSFVLSDDILTKTTLESFRQKMNDIGEEFNLYRNPKTKPLINSGII